MGYFPQWERVGPEVVEHVRAPAVEVTGLGIAPPGRVSDRMFRRCRELVRQHTGAVWDPDRVHAVAENAMRQALQGKDNPADVIHVALEELTGQGCELPAYSMLDRLAGALRAEVNGGFYRLVAGRLDAAARGALAGLLVVDRETRQSAHARPRPWPLAPRIGRSSVAT